MNAFDNLLKSFYHYDTNPIEDLLFEAVCSLITIVEKHERRIKSLEELTKNT